MPQMEHTVLQYDTQFLQAFSSVSKLPCCLWSDSFFWSSGDSVHPCGADLSLRAALSEDSAPEKPFLYFEDEFVFWGVLRLWKYHIAVGPAECNSPGPGYSEQYARRHGLQTPYPLVKTTFGEMTQCLSLLTCHFWGQPVPGGKIEIRGAGAENAKWESEGDVEQYQLSQSENDRSHKSGTDFSGQLVEAVRAGEPERVRELMNGVLPDLYENAMVADTEQKQLEYMAVSLITILTRAAVSGGMRMEDAHELGDVYLRRIAASSRGGTFTTLLLRAMLEFATEVRKSKDELRRTSYVEACKSYVSQNLRKNIRVGDVGPAIGVSRTHLAHLFKAEEGISLQNYIQREKCRHAERLLKFSDYPIALISEYFGFSSPSYFGVCFREWYGMTPKEYRKYNAQR